MWRKHLTVFFILLFGLCFKCTFAQQASTEEYGQTRIQQKTFEWYYYDSTNFRAFYSSNGKYLAQQALQQAELDLPIILNEMGGRLPRKMNIIIYNSYTDYKQTNTGRYNEELSKSNGGVFDVNGDNIVVYYNGRRDNMRKQIRYGIANVIKDQMLFGNSLKDVVKNALVLNIPKWFTMGYVNYIAYDWDADKNAKLTSIIAERKRNGKIKTKYTLPDFAIYNPEVIGHSFWNYLGNTYGQNSIKNLIYLVRMRKPIKDAIQEISGKPIKDFYADWKKFYASEDYYKILEIEKEDTTKKNKISLNKIKNELAHKTFELENIAGRKLWFSIKPKTGAVLRNFAVSPLGTDVVYCEFINGTYNIILHQIKNNKKTTIIEGGIRTSSVANDPLYPIMCWSNDGKKLAVMYEKDFIQMLKIWDGVKGRVTNRAIPNNRFDRVTGMQFMDDDEKLLLTFVKKGQSDIGILTIRNTRITNLNKDVLDDISPSYVYSNKQQGFLFMSNRMTPNLNYSLVKNEYPNAEFQIYFYDAKKASPALLKITNAADVKFSEPIQYGADCFAFLMENNGIKKRYIAFAQKDVSGKDSVNYYVNNEMSYSILHHEYVKKLFSVADVIEQNNLYYIYLTKTEVLDSFDKLLLPDTIQVLKKKTEYIKKIDENKPNIFFLSEFEEAPADSSEIVLIQPIADSNKKNNPDKNNSALVYTAPADTKDTSTKRMKSKEYTITFSPDFFQTSFDNSLLINKYQPYSYNTNGLFTNPGMNGLIKLSLMDVMEDYKLTGAFRISPSLSDNLYYIKFNNYKKYIDWEITFMHSKQNKLYPAGQLPLPYTSIYDEVGKYTTNYLQTTVVKPINYISFYKFIFGLRADQLKFYSIDELSSNFVPDRRYWTTLRSEYVFDNSIQKMRNIYFGTRLKFFVEGGVQLNKGKSNYYIFGTDSRYYKNIYKNIITASRFAMTIGGGTSPLLFNLGGMDNQISVLQNPNGLLDTSINYSYQTAASQLRGFPQNARGGTSYYSLTQEVRIPIINTITKRQLKSDFLNNLQTTLFFEGGTAWNGFFFKYKELERNFLSTIGNVQVIYSHKEDNRFAYSYGFGLRSKLLGYFARGDFAWRPDNPKPRFHLSLATDF